MRVLTPLIGVALAGCVSSTRIDPTLIRRYQQRLVATGPRVRLSGSLVRPARGTTGSPLRTVKDPNTGQTQIPLALTDVIHRTLRNNPAIQVVAYDPAMSRTQVATAEAAFDATVFAGVELDYTDSASRSSGSATVSKTRTVEAGVRQRLTTGGQVEVKHTVARQDDNSDFTLLNLNPSYRQNFAIELTQPLLRDAGPDVALAELRVARINYASSLEAFRGAVLDEILEVQATYWQLVRARQELEIQERLLDLTRQTYEQVKARSELDASKVQITQTRAAVESRQAVLIRARKNILDIQDALVRKMADASLTLLDDYVLVPVTEPSTAELLVDRIDQISSALKYSPELSQARKAIQINDIGVTFARNQILPRLELSASAGLNGLGGDFDSSWSQAWGGDYISYNLSLAFEWPIGSRAARAQLERAKYQRGKNVAALQKVADQAAAAVNASVRQIETTFLERQAQERALIATQENLKALEVRRDYRQELNPEFLGLILAAQENVANAERALLQATVDYNIAQAQLHRATGTSLEAMGVKILDAGDDPVELVADRVRLPGDSQAAPASSPATSPAVLRAGQANVQATRPSSD